MSRTILLCFDGSPESERALVRAAELAHALTAELTVVSVADELYRSQPYSGWADPGEIDEHRRLLERAADELSVRGVDAATVEPEGEPAEALLEQARLLDADLIVVGTRHRGLLKRLLFGSVSGELVVEAPCDVLVVR